MRPGRGRTLASALTRRARGLHARLRRRLQDVAMTLPVPELRLLLAAALCAPLLTSQAAVPEPVESGRVLAYRGEARAPEGGALLYVEEHLLREGPQGPSERLVLYRCADGTAFARKQVDYGETPLAPAFELVDARLDYREGLRREGDALQVFGGIGDSFDATAVEAAENLVADAGFDLFVLTHWSRLQAGETVPIDFLVPSRGRAYGFRLRKVEALELDGAAASRIRLSLSGLFGLFAPPIDVIYRDSDRWLLRFEGLTNIRESASSNLVAHIVFPQPPAPVDATQWAQASAQPLQACAIPGAG
jgi:hypothetical protein